MSEAVFFDSEEEEDKAYWSAILLFPMPSACSDQSMRVEFRHLDGRWSLPVQEAYKRFKAEGLELNENWAFTPQFWSCPACGRNKPDIVRLSKRGVLLAKLDSHHDHSGDNLLYQILASDVELRALRRGQGLLLGHIKRLAIRFERVLICSDCNSADGAVKARLRGVVDARFSFSPAEISQFVRVRPNEPHEIDVEKALSIWQEQHPVFRKRDALIRQLHEAVRDGILGHDLLGWGATRISDRALSFGHYLIVAFAEACRDNDGRARLSELASDFLARSTSRDMPRVQIAPPREQTLDPDQEQLAVYEDTASPGPWKATDDEWRCPVCERTRRQAVRISKSKRLSGGVGLHFEHVETFDPEEIYMRSMLFPNFTNRRFLAEILQAFVCTDCRNVATRLGQQIPSLGRPHLNLADLKAVILDCAPHQAHNYDAGEAAARATANQSLVNASSALSAMHALGTRCRVHFDYLRANAISEVDAWSIIAQEIPEFETIDLEGPIAAVRWLVARCRDCQ